VRVVASHLLNLFQSFVPLHQSDQIDKTRKLSKWLTFGQPVKYSAARRRCAFNFCMNQPRKASNAASHLTSCPPYGGPQICTRLPFRRRYFRQITLKALNQRMVTGCGILLTAQKDSATPCQPQSHSVRHSSFPRIITKP
jgi:hypothetical protein